MAEEPLPAGGSCLLGSINLSEFVINAFTNKADINFKQLEEAVVIAVHGLNHVLIEGLSLHPLEIQRETVNNWRQIGLGICGMADMFIKLGIIYGSKDSLKLIEKVFRSIAVTAVKASLALAKSEDCYPMCNKEATVKSLFIQALGLPEEVLSDIKKYGLYNSQLLTCAPTGSIATMIGVSTGIEPIFAIKYTRKTQSLNNKDTYYDVYTPIADYYIHNINKKLPEYFVESKDIAYQDRLNVQSTIQNYIDASISSTINLPKESSIEDVYNIYIEAWKKGLKGVTIYRQGCNREGILTTENGPTEIPVTKAPKRPKELKADCYSIKVKGEQFIVVVGLLNDKPYEVFAFKVVNYINIPDHKGIITKEQKGKYSFKSEYFNIDNLVSEMEPEEQAVTLYCSMLLRHGIDIEFVKKTTKKVNNLINSFSSAICRVLSKYITESGVGKCPKCGGNLIFEGGCYHCDSCEYSKCE